MNISKLSFKDTILCLKNSRTLGAWNRQFSSKGEVITCSYAILGICKAIFRGRDLFFVWNLILVYISRISNIFFFNFDNLEPAPQDVQLQNRR